MAQVGTLRQGLQNLGENHFAMSWADLIPQNTAI